MEVVTMMPSQGLDTTLGMAALVGLLVLGAIAIRTHDRKRRREDDVLVLQARMTDALLQERRLSGFSVVPTVRWSLRRRSPVTVEISGAVPRAELRELAIRVAIETMSNRRTDFRIEDRIMVDPYLAPSRAA